MNYLEYTFVDDENFISSFDEAPLWSAAFGLLLLKHLPLARDMTVVDMGSGAGFPLFELAGRLGPSATLYGVDPWQNAQHRARQKMLNYAYKNVQLLTMSGESLPMADDSVDLVVSNLGLNNFGDPHTVLLECSRVLKPGGRLALTSNLTGHWQEFYEVLYQALSHVGKTDLIQVFQDEEKHRGTLNTLSQLLEDAGFKISRHYEEVLPMNFANGTAFLNHHFVKVGWLTNWLSLVPKQDHQKVFGALEQALNEFAHTQGGLKLTVPMIYLEAEKR